MNGIRICIVTLMMFFQVALKTRCVLREELPCSWKLEESWGRLWLCNDRRVDFIAFHICDYGPRPSLSLLCPLKTHYLQGDAIERNWYIKSDCSLQWLIFSDFQWDSVFSSFSAKSDEEHVYPDVFHRALIQGEHTSSDTSWWGATVWYPS